ncbi:CCA tRNA nucleotidyltransferase [Chroococcidiopsis sp. CCMEE 29]|uniref:CCA tRNA nucleotidyltransferase n=1 Tax=Chroococcidiopsis sp. CCMEE 29 TaxID=155894 RepID=UPI002020DCF5|nr:CCA tRNA nucleotidyltransferase [Chroococcidiopsis sp. CCMEE 29]
MCDSSLSVLSPETWPFSLEWLPQPAYLVGGAVRDALLSRRCEYVDLDFVLPRAVKIARAIAKHYQAGFVLLDAERQIARVVFKHATVDFAQQEGSTLETDLRRRDFTVNAIAYNPHNGEIIDPLQGCADLQQGVLRMVSAKNLQDDPLRLLRAYRQAAQLGFIIESDTQSVIRQLAPQLSQVAAERVRVELGYLLSSSAGTLWLITAWEDGLLATWFKSATQEQLAQVAAVDRAAVVLAQSWHTLGWELSQLVREPLKTTWLSIAKLTCLVNKQPEVAEAELTQLTYSRAEIRAVSTALKLLPQLKVLSTQMSLREQYFLFRTAGSVFPTLAVLAVANGISVEAITPLINRYLTPDDPVAHPTPLVTGNELMQALNLRSSPLVGELLMQIQLAYIEGKISTPAEAIELASQLVVQSDRRTFIL